MTKNRLMNRGFTFIILGQAISLLSTMLLKFSISLYILDLTGSASLFGAITAMSVLPPIVLSPFGGILADRKNKRNLMVGLDSCYGVLALSLAVLIGASFALTAITVILILLSVFASFEIPVVQSAVPLTQPKENIIKANALVSQIGMLASLIGPLLAGFVYGFLGERDPIMGMRVIFIGCGALFIIASVFESFIKLPTIKLVSAENVLATVKNDLVEGIRFVSRNKPSVLYAIILNALFLLLINPLLIVGVPYLVRITLGLSAELNGIAQAATGAGGIAGGVIAGMIGDKFAVRKLYLLFVGMGVAVLGIGLSFLFGISPLAAYGVIVVCCTAILVLAGIAGVIITASIQKIVPSMMLGRVMAFYGTIANSAIPIGMLLYGYLYERFPNGVFAIMLFTATAIWLVGFSGRGSYRQLEKDTC